MLVNPTLTKDELINRCRENGVVGMAYTPYGAIRGRKNDYQVPLPGTVTRVHPVRICGDQVPRNGATNTSQMQSKFQGFFNFVANRK